MLILGNLVIANAPYIYLYLVCIVLFIHNFSPMRIVQHVSLSSLLIPPYLPPLFVQQSFQLSWLKTVSMYYLRWQTISPENFSSKGMCCKGYHHIIIRHQISRVCGSSLLSFLLRIITIFHGAFVLFHRSLLPTL